MRIPFRKRKNSQSPDVVIPLDKRFPDVERGVLKILERVAPYTMTSPERLIALCDAARYVVKKNIPGDLVECGVWRGGSMMAAALALQDLNHTQKTLWLYDTFDGMTQPTDCDVDHSGQDAASLLSEQKREDRASIWCYSPLQEVKQNISSTQYPADKVRCVVGDVHQTIPESVPDEISLLRLDTDWYESTRHELVNLFPRLSPGGVIIIDDYGHWEGCRKAVDEYFAETGIPILLNRIDYTGRVGIKPANWTSHSMKNYVRKAG